jgi:hypothetical protein
VQQQQDCVRACSCTAVVQQQLLQHSSRISSGLSLLPMYQLQQMGLQAVQLLQLISRSATAGKNCLLIAAIAGQYLLLILPTLLGLLPPQTAELLLLVKAQQQVQLMMEQCACQHLGLLECLRKVGWHTSTRCLLPAVPLQVRTCQQQAAPVGML